MINSDGIKHLTVPYTGLRVAPTRVRVAIVIDSDELTFGAISGQQGPAADHALASAAEPAERHRVHRAHLVRPGQRHHARPGPRRRDRVPGERRHPTSIPVEPGMETITASWGTC